MPVYTITPRRSMHYHPLALFLGHRGCSPVPRSSPALVPSIFRGIEQDLASMDTFFNNLTSGPAIRNFQPRFDVREEKDAFHLQGEIPGVEADNLQVEFVDRNTMVIKGRTVRQSQRGNSPAADDTQATTQDKGKAKAVEGASDQTDAAQDAMETEPTSRPSTPASGNSNYHKATVEAAPDADNDFVDVQAEDATSAEQEAATPATTAAAAPESNLDKVVPQEATHSTHATSPQTKDDGYYWVSERSVGEFQRSFRFPGQVDQENVKASLKDGILNVTVPKVAEAGPRKINVE